MQDLVGTIWGRFQIIEERGHGGMAIVYRAYDNVLQRTVALKVLLSVLADNPEFTQRFRREAITAANLRHPNIVVIYDVGEQVGFQFIVMEYIDGPTLQQEIQRRGALPISRIIPILVQLASALDYAHQQGLVHRDVKPANVMISAHDRVTLTDFGLVRAMRRDSVTTEGQTSGTLKYMSPEQAMGRELDARSDVYSLGVVLYEMLTGEAPFAATTPYHALRELMHGAPPPPSRLNPHVDPRVEQVVLQALAKEPDRRFPSAGRLAGALAAVVGLGVTVYSAQPDDTARREIVLHLGSADGREYPLCRGETTIGRDTSNDVVLPVTQVSRHHARVECDAAGCRVTDLGSTNGTFVNGMRLQPNTAYPLSAGDILGVGPVNLLALPPAQRRQLPGTEILSIPR